MQNKLNLSLVIFLSSICMSVAHADQQRDGYYGKKSKGYWFYEEEPKQQEAVETPQEQKGFRNNMSRDEMFEQMRESGYISEENEKRMRRSFDKYEKEIVPSQIPQHVKEQQEGGSDSSNPVNTNANTYDYFGGDEAKREEAMQDPKKNPYNQSAKQYQYDPRFKAPVPPKK